MLWQLIKSKMLENPTKIICDENNSITYIDMINTVDSFSKNLNQNKYGIMCNSELSTAIAILSCFAAGVVAVPLSIRYGENHYNNIIENIELSNFITDESGILKIKTILPKFHLTFLLRKNNTLNLS